LTDVFAIQTDLAREIAALAGQLLRAKKRTSDESRRQNSEAYLLGLQARELFRRPKIQRDALSRRSAREGDQARPKLAMAFAHGAIENWIFHSYDSTQRDATKAKAASIPPFAWIRDARSAPHSGFFYYIATATTVTTSVRWMSSPSRNELPNDAEVYMAIGAIERRQGKWAQSTEHLERAAALDPRRVGDAESRLQFIRPQEIEMADKTLDRGLPPRRSSAFAA